MPLLGYIEKGGGGPEWDPPTGRSLMDTDAYQFLRLPASMQTTQYVSYELIPDRQLHVLTSTLTVSKEAFSHCQGDMQDWSRGLCYVSA